MFLYVITTVFCICSFFAWSGQWANRRTSNIIALKRDFFLFSVFFFVFNAFPSSILFFSRSTVMINPKCTWNDRRWPECRRTDMLLKLQSILFSMYCEHRWVWWPSCCTCVCTKRQMHRKIKLFQTKYVFFILFIELR